jgi:hypothetical protein
MTVRPFGVVVARVVCEGTTTVTGPIFKSAFRSASSRLSVERFIVKLVFSLIRLITFWYNSERGLCVYVKPRESPFAWTSCQSFAVSMEFPRPGKSPATAYLQRTPAGMAFTRPRKARHGVLVFFQWIDTGPDSP